MTRAARAKLVVAAAQGRAPRRPAARRRPGDVHRPGRGDRRLPQGRGGVRGRARGVGRDRRPGVRRGPADAGRRRPGCTCPPARRRGRLVGARRRARRRSWCSAPRTTSGGRREGLLAAGRSGRTPVVLTSRGTTVHQRSVACPLSEVGDDAGAGRARPAADRRRRRGRRAARQGLVVRDEAAVRLAGARAADQAAGRRDGRPARGARRGRRGGADDLRRAAADPAPDGEGGQGPGHRPLRVDRVHLGERRPRGAGEVRGVRPGRAGVRRPQDRRGRRGDRRGAARLGHRAGPRAGGEPVGRAGCSRTGRRTTRCSTRSTGCSCRGPTSRPTRWSPGLQEAGWEVDDVTAYRTVRAAPPPADVREAIKTGQFDAVVFTSSSTVRNLVGHRRQAARDDRRRLHRAGDREDGRGARAAGRRPGAGAEHGLPGRGAGGVRQRAAAERGRGRRAGAAAEPAQGSGATVGEVGRPGHVGGLGPMSGFPRVRPRRLRVVRADAPAGGRDAAAPGGAGAAGVRQGGRDRAGADRVDARRRPAHARVAAQGGRGGRRRSASAGS